MTKQQIVAQLVAAKIGNSGNMSSDEDYYLNYFGKLADKIMEMFPEPDYSITVSQDQSVIGRDWEIDFDRHMEGVK